MRKTWIVTTLGAAALIGAQLIGVAPASAVSGLVRVVGAATDFGHSKSAQADCPAGKRIVGGGAVVSLADPADANKVRITQLVPVHPGSGADGYIGGAQEVGAGGTGTWDLLVFAVCADPIPGLHLVSGSGALGSANVQSVSATCPAGEVVLGGGGLVRNPGFQVDLRTAAPSANGDRFTAIGGEGVDGYPDNWSVVAYAMCAPRPPGYQIVATTSLSLPTDSRKATTTTCPAGKRVHGTGAATSQSPLGGIGLEQVFPQASLLGTQALAVITEPVPADWGDVRSFAICAT